MRVLLLDNTFLPVRVINWQKAMILFLTGKAEVVEEYDSVDIRSTTTSFKLPKVLRLFTRFRYQKHVKFSRDNVFIRDNYSCQYCGQAFMRQLLTLDHVIPRSKGGGTNWQNVVTCCQKCNNKKGSKLPEEFHLKLKKSPVAPNWSPAIYLRFKKEDPDEWFNYISHKLREKLLA
jgi:5-methylcytosine-specific restriction endonuclease McrA